MEYTDEKGGERRRLRIADKMGDAAVEEGTGEEDSPGQMLTVIILLSFLSVVGTSGNALVLYVFKRKKDELASTLFIMVLAGVDFVTCLIIIPFTVYMESVRYMVCISTTVARHCLDTTYT